MSKQLKVAREVDSLIFCFAQCRWFLHFSLRVYLFWLSVRPINYPWLSNHSLLSVSSFKLITCSLRTSQRKSRVPLKTWSFKSVKIRTHSRRSTRESRRQEKMVHQSHGNNRSSMFWWTSGTTSSITYTSLFTITSSHCCASLFSSSCSTCKIRNRTQWNLRRCRISADYSTASVIKLEWTAWITELPASQLISLPSVIDDHKPRK